MADPTAAEMVTTLKAALETNAAVVSISVDGMTVRYNRAEAMAELAKWEAAAARATNTRPVAARIVLNGF